MKRFQNLSTALLWITFCAKCKKYVLLNREFVVINNKIQNLLINVDNIHLRLYNLTIHLRKEERVMKNLFTNGFYSNDYTNNSDWAGYQAGTSSCAYFVELVHAAFGAVCTFVLALLAIAILRGALGVLISLAIINIGLIGLIIIADDNRIVKAKELYAAA